MDGVAQWLRSNRLTRFMGALESIGVECVDDLLDVRRPHLENMGMKVLQIERFERVRVRSCCVSLVVPPCAAVIVVVAVVVAPALVQASYTGAGVTSRSSVLLCAVVRRYVPLCAVAMPLPFVSRPKRSSSQVVWRCDLPPTQQKLP